MPNAPEQPRTCLPFKWWYEANEDGSYTVYWISDPEHPGSYNVPFNWWLEPDENDDYVFCWNDEEEE